MAIFWLDVFNWSWFDILDGEFLHPFNIQIINFKNTYPSLFSFIEIA
jgi:hypothetical protein